MGGELSHKIYIYLFMSCTFKKTYNSVNYSPVKLEKKFIIQLIK